MHDNIMNGFPREKINMAKNLKNMIICKVARRHDARIG
tara:strand:+ start:2381 stop:2494 length:114 start_codon:yes stop_codon:yes gene_type:complete